MKLALVNGSPRGKKSNSRAILNWLIRNIKNDVTTLDITVSDVKHHQKSVEALAGCDYIAFSFPLYTDLMPGVVKHFFEEMDRQKNAFKDIPILYIVHSGFPEMVHSRLTERYCQHFTELMEMRYMGTLILAGSEAIMYVPERLFKRKMTAVVKIGEAILTKKPYTPEDLNLPGQVEQMSKFKMAVMKAFPIFFDMFWNNQLKKNGAYKQRYDQPYAPKQ